MSDTNVVERVLDRFPERGPLPHIEIPDAFTGFFSSAHRAACRSINFSVKALSGQRAWAFDDRALPTLPRHPWSGWHAALDELVLIYFELGRSGEFENLDFERLELEVEDLIEHHDHRGVTDDPFTHHDDPPAPTNPYIVPHTLDGAEGEWMTFASDWEPTSAGAGRSTLARRHRQRHGPRRAPPSPRRAPPLGDVHPRRRDGPGAARREDLEGAAL